MTTEPTPNEEVVSQSPTPYEVVDSHEIIGTFAVVEEAMSYEPLYRIRIGDKTTRWGRFSDLFMLEGSVFISPYFTEHNDWRMVSTEDALDYICIQEPT